LRPCADQSALNLAAAFSKFSGVAAAPMIQPSASRAASLSDASE